MANIQNINYMDKNKAVLTIECSRNEITNLTGATEDIIVIPGDRINIDSRVSMRGKNDSTVYLLIPKEHRMDIVKSRDATCYRMDTDSEIIMVYKIPKK